MKLCLPLMVPVVLLAACRLGPKPEPTPPTSAQLVLGDNQVLFRNDSDEQICTVDISLPSSATNPILYDAVNPEMRRDKDRPKLLPHAELTIGLQAKTYKVFVEDCLGMVFKNVDNFVVGGPMVVSIGAKPGTAPPGQTYFPLALGDMVPSDTPAGPTCSPLYASEVDPTKCCSGRIDTKDHGSHYFCAPAKR